jgi:hypothetical protein
LESHFIKAVDLLFPFVLGINCPPQLEILI